MKDGYRWVIDIDLEKFFNKVHHHRLMRTMESKDQRPESA
nr:hypothetical protein [Clostridium sp. 1xD42-85]